MDEKTKQDFIQLFNQGFEEVVQPQLEEIRREMATKGDINQIYGNIKQIREEMVTKDDLEKLERKIDRLLDKSEDHHQRLEAIESLPIIAHQLKK